MNCARPRKEKAVIGRCCKKRDNKKSGWLLAKVVRSRKAMAEEEGSKPKYEVEEISIKTRVQKILDLSTSRWLQNMTPNKRVLNSFLDL